MSDSRQEKAKTSKEVRICCSFHLFSTWREVIGMIKAALKKNPEVKCQTPRPQRLGAVERRRLDTSRLLSEVQAHLRAGSSRRCCAMSLRPYRRFAKP